MKFFDKGTILIIILVFVTHFLLLLNDGVYWDHYLTYVHAMRGETDMTWGHAMQMGFIAVAALQEILYHLPNPIVWYKIITFLALIILSISIFKICINFSLVNTFGSLIISLLITLYSGFKLYTVGVLLPYILGLSIIPLAFWTYLKNENATKKSLKWVYRIISIVIFFLAYLFYHGALLFHYGIILFLFVILLKSETLKFKKIFYVLLKRIELLLIPILIYFGEQLIFPKHGEYGEIYQITFGFDKIWPLTKDFILNGMCQWIYYPLWTLRKDYLILAILLFIGIIAYIIIRKYKYLEKYNSCSEKTTFALIIFSVVFFIAGIIPYVLTNNSPYGVIWWYRNNAIVIIPYALFWGGIILLIFNFTKTWVRDAIAALLLIGYLIPSWILIQRDYLSFQARWAYHRSIMLNLHKLQDVNEVSFLWIDETDIAPFGCHGYTTARGNIVATAGYEWPAIFAYTNWGNEAINASDRSHASNYIEYFETCIGETNKQIAKQYYISKVDYCGCQAELIITKGQNFTNNLDISMKYIYHRFIDLDGMDQYLLDIISMNLNLFKDSKSKHCNWKKS